MTSRPSRHHDLTALAPHDHTAITVYDLTALAPHGSTALAPHDLTTLAPHDFTALAPHDPRPSRPYLGPGRSAFDLNAAHRPVMPIVDVPSKGTKVAGTRGTSRRLVETAAGAYASTPPDRASTSRSAPSPVRASTSGSAPPQAPRGTQRDEPAQVGRVHPKPPRCSPLGDSNGVQTPRAAPRHTPQTSGRGRKFKNCSFIRSNHRDQWAKNNCIFTA